VNEPLGALRVGVPVARTVGRPCDNGRILARVRAAFTGDDAAWTRTERRILALWQLCGTQLRTLEEDAPTPLAVHVVPLAHEALARAGLGAGDVDLLVHGDLARERYEPATAAGVADALGAHAALPVDVSSACASWVLAVHDVLGRMTLDPHVRVALVTTATLTAGHLRYAMAGPGDVDTLGAGLTLGNAASATLIVRAPLARGDTVWSVPRALHAAGLPAHHALCDAPVGGHFTSRGAELFALARHVPGHLAALCARAGWPMPEVDAWALHQPSTRALRDLARAVGVAPDRMPSFHAEHGNCAASAVPLAWATLAARGRCPPGARVGLSAAASGFVMAGLAVEVV
jgi:3-oxoacyl-[acyl-carrier-protein] synthase-3